MLIHLCEQLAGIPFRIQPLLTGILLPLLSPKEMSELIRTHYNRSDYDVAAPGPESWEADVLAWPA